MICSSVYRDRFIRPSPLLVRTLLPLGRFFREHVKGNAALLQLLARNVDEAHIVDFNQPTPDFGAPDLVLLAEVLEHLIHPERLLADMVNAMAEDATVTVSLPGIANLSIPAPMFFLGRFDYEDAGIFGSHAYQILP
jgi:hypothetical protein